MNGNRPAVIVPAHNEEVVITRTLTTLLRSAEPGEFEVFVVCNGCHDRTAERVRADFADVNVIELTEASKTAAINAGIQASNAPKVMLLDADIELSTDNARALINALDAPGIEAAIGHMSIDDSGSSWLVRSFYRVWAQHPYLKNGKFAAAIAISKSALDRIAELPSVVADDTYLQRMIPADRVAVVETVHFLARVPKSLRALIRVRSRIHRGNRELQQALPSHTQAPKRQARQLAGEVWQRPSLWLHVPCYLTVAVAARLLSTNGNQTWERDLTTRSTAS